MRARYRTCITRRLRYSNEYLGRLRGVVTAKGTLRFTLDEPRFPHTVEP
jgi:hypothetical protein